MEKLKKDADLPIYKKNVPAQVQSVSADLKGQKAAARPAAIQQSTVPTKDYFKQDFRFNPSQSKLKDRISNGIACTESSCGTNLEHSPVTEGVHKGTSTVSRWGVMPRFAKEVADKHRPLKNSEVGQQILAAKNSKQINQIIKNNPHLDKEVFDHIMDWTESRVKLFAKNKDHVEPLAILAHNKGITGAMNIYDEGGINAVKDHDYVKKTYKHMDDLKDPQSLASQHISNLEKQIYPKKVASLEKSLKDIRGLLAKSLDDEEVETTNEAGHALIDGKYHSLKFFKDKAHEEARQGVGSVGDEHGSAYHGETHGGIKVKGDEYPHRKDMANHVQMEEWFPKGSKIPKSQIVGKT